MMKQIKNVPPSKTGKFAQSALLSVSPDAQTAIKLYVKAENAFNHGSYRNTSGFSEAVLLCREIIAKYSGALSDGHSMTLVDTKLLLAKSLWHLGRDGEALAVLSEAGTASAHHEISEWFNICQKK